MSDTCGYITCNRPIQVAKSGLCKAHNQQRILGHELKPLGKGGHNKMYDDDDQCVHEGCTKKPAIKWLCPTHYQYMKWHETHSTKEAVDMDEFERQCGTCKQIKWWDKMVQWDNPTKTPLCRDCYTKQAHPTEAKKESKNLLSLIQYADKMATKSDG
jgi:hypothetical protein